MVALLSTSCGGRTPLGFPDVGDDLPNGTGGASRALPGGDSGVPSSTGARSGGSNGTGGVYNTMSHGDSGATPSTGASSGGTTEEGDSGAATSTGCTPVAGDVSSVADLYSQWVADDRDPHAEERAQLVEEYCALPDTLPCLIDVSATRTCTENAELSQASASDVCWDEWASLVRCEIDTLTCPCSGTDCFFGLIGADYITGGNCAAERDALSSCAPYGYGVLAGSIGTCSYQIGKNVCAATCEYVEGIGYFKMVCEGPPDGLQSCHCQLNDVTLDDDALSDGTCYRWSANSCEEAAEVLASGYCHEMVDCCFTRSNEGSPGCRCMADPTVAGYATCEEAAAAAGGEVVDLCPQYAQVR